MTEEQFTGIINKAQKMITDSEFNRNVEMAASAYSKGSKGFSGDAQISMLEEQVFGGSSKLDSSQLNMIRNRGTESANSIIENAAINEQTVLGRFASQLPQTSTYAPIQSNGGGIDYSLIKSLIDESISRHISELNKGMLNEGVNSNQMRGMMLSEGNKIQFLDKKGNLYEGVLKLKKKAN